MTDDIAVVAAAFTAAVLYQGAPPEKRWRNGDKRVWRRCVNIVGSM